MKPRFKLQLLASRRSDCGQILGVALICAIVSFSAGCSKPKSPASSAPTPPTTNATQSTPISQSPSVNSSAASTDATSAAPDLRPLNRALLEWRMQNRRVPANFQEFAASANIKIPPPPPGKKYIINSSGLISLVDRSPNGSQ
jgi:hypothetical protein